MILCNIVKSFWAKQITSFSYPLVFAIIFKDDGWKTFSGKEGRTAMLDGGWCGVLMMEQAASKQTDGDGGWVVDLFRRSCTARVSL